MLFIYVHIKGYRCGDAVRAFSSHAEGWLFESQPRQILVVKSGIDSSTAKRLATGVSVTGPRRLPL